MQNCAVETVFKPLIIHSILSILPTVKTHLCGVVCGTVDQRTTFKACPSHTMANTGLWLKNYTNKAKNNNADMAGTSQRFGLIGLSFMSRRVKPWKCNYVFTLTSTVSSVYDWHKFFSTMLQTWSAIFPLEPTVFVCSPWSRSLSSILD